MTKNGWKRSAYGPPNWSKYVDGKEVGRIYKRRGGYHWEAYNSKNIGSMLHKDNRGVATTLAEAKKKV